jgi:hypothetical protein
LPCPAAFGPHVSDLRYPAIRQGDIGHKALVARAVDHGPVPDYDIALHLHLLSDLASLVEPSRGNPAKPKCRLMCFQI